MEIVVYYLVYFIMVIESLKANQSKLITKILYVFLFLLAGISINGKDKIPYGVLFDLYPSLIEINYNFFNNDIAPIGYKILISVIKILTKNFNFFIIAISLIGNIFYFKGSNYIKKKFGINVWEMMIIYYPICYFSLNFSSYKQYIAAMIFFYSLRYLFEREFKKYILLIILSFTFHESGIILLIFVPIFYFKRFYIKIFTTLICSFILYKVVLLKIDPIYLSEQKGILGLILATAYIIAAGIYLYKSERNIDGKNIFCVILFYFLLIILFYGKTNFMYRFNLYFYCMFQFFFPLIFKKIKLKKIYILTFSTLGIIYLNLNLSRKEIYVPYKTIFFNSYLESRDWDYEEVKNKFKNILYKK